MSQRAFQGEDASLSPGHCWGLGGTAKGGALHGWARFTIPVLGRSVEQLSHHPMGIQDLSHMSWHSPWPYKHHPPMRTKGLLISFGLLCLSCGTAKQLGVPCTPSMDTMLSGATANFPHCTSILRITPFKLYTLHMCRYMDLIILKLIHTTYTID